MKTIVIALGGNAILKKGEKPSLKMQMKNTKKAIKAFFPLIKGHQAVITHGNGPQAGYLMLQQEAGKGMPLDVLDAETEGQIGYILQQNIKNQLLQDKVDRNTVTILTQVLVDEKDPAFKNPTKFVGPYYNDSEARRMKKRFPLRKDADKGWRRVVPSPKPLEIIEAETIRNMMVDGVVVIAAGGGGIPVIKKGKTLKGAEAVIDKDLASACLGNSVFADTLLIVTDVDAVYMNYKKKGQKRINKIKKEELRLMHHDGHFPPGSMGPKIRAAINFLDGGGKSVMITNIANIQKGLKGKAGTLILKDG